MQHWLSQEHGHILHKKAQGFQDSCRMTDLFPNVDHTLLGNGTDDDQQIKSE